MDRYGNGEEFLMDKVLNNVADGLSFRHFDRELFTGDFPDTICSILATRNHICSMFLFLFFQRNAFALLAGSFLVG